jgi:hypothetical protein
MTTRSRVVVLGTVIIVTVALIACAVYYQMYLRYDERLAVRVTHDVIVSNDFLSSVYLLRCDSGYIVFDAGFSERVIRRGLEYSRYNRRISGPSF